MSKISMSSNHIKGIASDQPFALSNRVKKWSWAGGIGFTFLIALIGALLAHMPGLDRIGQMACAILLAVAFRQLYGYPEALRTGIQFSSKKLLRYAIILYGLKLNIGVVLDQGAGLLLRDAATVVFSILVMIWLGKRMKADTSLTLLLGIGTGICGAAAIAAVSPILQSKEEDTAMGVGAIALTGTLFAVAYTVVRPFLPLSDVEFGMWAGVSLHEIAHVALAGAPAGQDGLAMALLAKLGRVFLLVPLCFLLMYVMKRRGNGAVQGKIEFPWFLLGFLAMSLFGSFVVGHGITLSPAVMDGVAKVTTFLLTMAMVGLGLNVSLKEMRERALRPVLALFITSLLLSGLSYLLI